MARSRLWFFGSAGSGDVARLAAERAVQAAPARGEPHLALATVCFHEGDSASAIRHLKRALRRAPTLADAHELVGRILLESGPAPEGLRSLAIALDMDPTLGRLRADVARGHALMGQWDTCDRFLEQCCAETPVVRPAWFVKTRVALWRKDQGTLRALLDHPVVRSFGDMRLSQMIELGLGLTRLALDQSLGGGLLSGATSPRSRAFRAQLVVEMLGVRGDREPMLRMLTESVDAGLCDLVWMDCCPLLQPLRADPRFITLHSIVKGRAAEVHAALSEP